jgi:ubiquinone/menaquinone biosynthesis C-methylase UbiE
MINAEPTLNKKWDEYYSKYEDTPVGRLAALINRHLCRRMVISELFKVVKKDNGLKMLEAGCGSGVMSSYLADRNEVTVMDLSWDALKSARKNFIRNKTTGQFVHCDILSMPFPDGSFDVVWNQGVIEHFRDPVPAMKEMMRITKHGGHAVIFIPVFFSPLQLVYLFCKSFHLMSFWPFDRQYFFTPKAFKRFMETAGYKNVEVKRLWLKSVGFSQVGYSEKMDKPL